MAVPRWPRSANVHAPPHCGAPGCATLLARLLALPMALLATAGHSQEQPGCQLRDGILNCAPGVSESPLPLIPIVSPTSGNAGETRASVPAPPVATARLALVGRAREGAWLRATLIAPGQAPPSDSACHWYHKPPGRLRWELIAGATGPTYRLQRNDMAYDVMVLVVLPSSAGSSRLISKPIGPVMALGTDAP